MNSDTENETVIMRNLKSTPIGPAFAACALVFGLSIAGCSGNSVDGNRQAEEEDQTSTSGEPAGDRTSEQQLSQETSGPTFERPETQSHSSATVAHAPESSFGTFDLVAERTQAKATIPGLGNVTIEADGSFSIGPTPVYDPDTGKDISDDSSYTSRLMNMTFEREGRAETLDFEAPNSSKLTGSGQLIHNYEQGLSVRYRNDSHGLKQSLVIDEEFAGSNSISLRWHLPEEFSAERLSDGSIKVQTDGEHVLDWSGMKVYDAKNDTVPAEMTVVGDKLVYLVDSEGKDFPLTIDPLAQSPDFNESGNQAAGFFGHTLGSAGDVNGDGYADMLVAEIGFNESGVASAGKAHLFLGSSSGLSNTAAWTTKGKTLEEFYGIGTGIGDINNDGNDDVVVSGFRWVSGGKDLGQVRLFLGGASQTGLQPSSTLEINGTQDKQFFGRSLAGGDFNCDGTPDVAISSPGYDGNALSNTGRVEIYFGSKSSPHLPSSASWTFTPSKGGGFIGQDTENAGDVDNDGCEDLLVGGGLYPNSNGKSAGAAMLFLGKSGGPASSPDWKEVGPADSTFGKRLTGADDINNDGFGDVAVGGWTANSDNGLVRVYYGNSNGLDSSASWTANGSNKEKLGHGLSAGDVNGYGTPDLVVSAPDEIEPQSGNRLGAIRLYLTSPTGSPSLSQTPNWRGYSNDAGSLFGFTTAVLDVDQAPSKEKDIFVGAPFHKNQSGQSTAGKVFGYHGVPTCYIGNTYYKKGETNPNNPCEECAPSSSKTSWSNRSQGAMCDDGDACTKMTTCNANGQCTGTQITCNDQNPCTKDQCDPQQGCTYPDEPQGTSCPGDGLSCTSDQCDGSGSCTHPVSSGCLIGGTCISKGTAKPSEPCKQCSPSASKTSYSAVSSGTSCDDGEFCTVNDACNTQGQCTGSKRDCAATLGPKVASCNQKFTCDDFADRCRASQPKMNNASCDDQNACTSSESCQNGVCTAQNTVTCSNPCKTCDPGTGMCTENRQDGSTCDNGDACLNATCQSGTCTDQGSVSCDDMNPCTADSCDMASGCANTPVSDGTMVGTPSCNPDDNLLKAATCMGGQPEDRQIEDCGVYKCRTNGMGTALCPGKCQQEDHCKEGNFCFDRPDDSDGDKECYGNRPPVANSGPSQSGFGKNERVSLDGSQSSDPDMDSPLEFQWELVDASCPQGGTPQLQRLQSALEADGDWNAADEKPTFRAPAPDCANEQLTFELVVNDGEFDSEPSQTTVSYGDCNQAPNAVISGQPATANWGETVTLDGSNSMPGCGDALTYSWSHTPDTPAIDTNREDQSSELEVSLPDICVEENTTYTFSLTVFDGVQNSEDFERDLTILGNGPCEGDGVEPDTGGETGPVSDAGPDVGFERPPIEGSSCFCGAPGDDGAPMAPVSLAAFLALTGALRLRRRR